MVGAKAPCLLEPVFRDGCEGSALARDSSRQDDVKRGETVTRHQQESLTGVVYIPDLASAQQRVMLELGRGPAIQDVVLRRATPHVGTSR